MRKLSRRKRIKQQHFRKRSDDLRFYLNKSITLELFHWKELASVPTQDIVDLIREQEFPIQDTP